jgi:DNA-binding NtrC family response regulator/pSer/pThr/pTyr-binding forkhead associated (FHA) protein
LPSGRRSPSDLRAAIRYDRIVSDDRTAPLITRTESVVFSPDVPGYVLVVTGRGTRREPLPAAGIAVIGRDPSCAIRVDESAVSRQHARIEVAGHRVWIEDLGSHNGTRVGGARIDEKHRLRSGDSISIGEATLVACLAPNPRAAVRLLGEEELVDQVRREVQRARVHDRPLALICVTLDRSAAEAAAALLPTALRLIDVAGHVDADHLYVLCPELSPSASADRCEELVHALIPAAPEIRAGIAHLPGDAIDASSLIAAARDAVGPGGESRVSRPDRAADVRRIGDVDVIVADPAMHQIYQLIERLGPSDLSVLLCGETGVGKELAARALHGCSGRADGAFVAVNCAALPDTLAESELFGYKRGAFSGADRDKSGYFEAAAGGTLFLDELGELPLALQSKLLRVAETGEVTPLGATEPVSVDVRIVSATNRDVASEVEAGRFRADLFYRLGAATIVIPPLRDRPRELPALARSLLARACESRGLSGVGITDLALAQLAGHRFPGNIRELSNAMSYAVALVEDGEVVQPHHLPGMGTPNAPPAAVAASGEQSFRPVADELVDLETRRMREALEATGGNQLRAAELIGMPRRTFTKKMARYGLRGEPAEG